MLYAPNISWNEQHLCFLRKLTIDTNSLLNNLLVTWLPKVEAYIQMPIDWTARLDVAQISERTDKTGNSIVILLIMRKMNVDGIYEEVRVVGPIIDLF